MRRRRLADASRGQPMSNFRIFAVAALFGVGLSAALATATVAATRSLTTVEVQPHEMDSAQGREDVSRRIARAAERYCSEPAITGRRFDPACANQVSIWMTDEVARASAESGGRRTVEAAFQRGI